MNLCEFKKNIFSDYFSTLKSVVRRTVKSGMNLGYFNVSEGPIFINNYTQLLPTKPIGRGDFYFPSPRHWVQ